MRREAVCDRTRFQLSLELDGELSELERLMVDAHVGGCASCHDFALTMTEAVDRIRVLPLEPLARQITLPARRRPAGGVLQLVSVAAAIAVVGLGSSIGFLKADQRPVEKTQTSATANGPTPYVDQVRGELQYLFRNVDRHAWRRV
jgi:anti-sigma factor RsiW